MNFDIRKQLLEYDSVMNKQREMVYSLRNQILDGRDVSRTIQEMITESLEEKIEQFIPAKVLPELWDTQHLTDWLQHVFESKGSASAEEWQNFSRPEIETKAREIAEHALSKREEELGSELFRQLQRMILLQMMDMAWKEHLYDLDQLKKGISLRAYAQKDPLVEFQKEAFNLFSQMMSRIREETVEYFFKVQVAPGEPQESSPLAPKSVFSEARAEKPEFEGQAIDTELLPSSSPTHTPLRPRQNDILQPTRKTADGSAPPPQVINPGKIGRNDPCFCGSGKKYKKCHGQ